MKVTSSYSEEKSRKLMRVTRSYRVEESRK
jgi:hypothetical protein